MSVKHPRILGDRTVRPLYGEVFPDRLNVAKVPFGGLARPWRVYRGDYKAAPDDVQYATHAEAMAAAVALAKADALLALPQAWVRPDGVVDVGVPDPVPATRHASLA